MSIKHQIIFILPDWLEPEKTIENLMLEYNRTTHFDLKIDCINHTSKDGELTYRALAFMPEAFYYLGMAVSRILE